MMTRSFVRMFVGLAIAGGASLAPSVAAGEEPAPVEADPDCPAAISELRYPIVGGDLTIRRPEGVVFGQDHYVESHAYGPFESTCGATVYKLSVSRMGNGNSLQNLLEQFESDQLPADSNADWSAPIVATESEIQLAVALDDWLGEGPRVLHVAVWRVDDTQLVGVLDTSPEDYPKLVDTALATFRSVEIVDRTAEAPAVDRATCNDWLTRYVEPTHAYPRPLAPEAEHRLFYEPGSGTVLAGSREPVYIRHDAEIDDVSVDGEACLGTVSRSWVRMFDGVEMTREETLHVRADLAPVDGHLKATRVSGWVSRVTDDRADAVLDRAVVVDGCEPAENAAGFDVCRWTANADHRGMLLRETGGHTVGVGSVGLAMGDGDEDRELRSFSAEPVDVGLGVPTWRLEERATWRERDACKSENDETRVVLLALQDGELQQVWQESVERVVEPTARRKSCDAMHRTFELEVYEEEGEPALRLVPISDDAREFGEPRWVWRYGRFEMIYDEE